MAPPSTGYFKKLTDLVRSRLSQVDFERLDINSARVVWEVHGSLDQLSIRFKEIFNQSGRIYSYYVIQQGTVLVGFDNYPDRRALEYKYGKQFTKHLSELIPHRHGHRKIALELTDEMTVDQFLNFLDSVKTEAS
jgi:hypothetical protein